MNNEDNPAIKKPWTVRDESEWQGAVECSLVLASEFPKSRLLLEYFFNPNGPKILPQAVQELPSKMELFNIFRTPGAVSDRNAHEEYKKLEDKLQRQQKRQVRAGFIYVVPRETFRTKWVMESRKMKILKTMTGKKIQYPKNTMEPLERQLTTEEAMELYTAKVEIHDPEYDTAAQNSAHNAVPSTSSSVAPTPAPPANLAQRHTPHLTDGFAPSPIPSMLQDLALRSTAAAIASSLPSTLPVSFSSETQGSRSESVASQNPLMPSLHVSPSNAHSLIGITPDTALSVLSTSHCASLSADGFAPLPTSSEKQILRSGNDTRANIDAMLITSQNSSMPSQPASAHHLDSSSFNDSALPLPRNSVPPPDFSLLDIVIPAKPDFSQDHPAATPPLSSRMTGSHSTDDFAAFPTASDVQNRHANLPNNEAAAALAALFAKYIPQQVPTACLGMFSPGQLRHALQEQRQLIQPDTSQISAALALPDTSLALLATSKVSAGFPPFQTYEEFLNSQPKRSTLDSGTPTPPQPILPPPTANNSRVYSLGHNDDLRDMTPHHHQPIPPAQCQPQPIDLSTDNQIRPTGHGRHSHPNRSSTPPAQTLEPIPESGRDSTPPPPLEENEKQNFATQSLLFIPPFRPESPQFGPPPHLQPMKSMNPNLPRYDPITLGNHHAPFNGKKMPHPLTWANQPYPWADKYPDMPMYPHPAHAPDIPPTQLKKAPTAHRAPQKPKKNEKLTQYDYRNLKENHEALSMYHRGLICEHSELQKKYECVAKEKEYAEGLATKAQKELLAANHQNNQNKSRMDFLHQRVDSCVTEVEKVTQEIQKERILRGELQRRITYLEAETNKMRCSIDEFNEAKTDFIEVLKANKLDCETLVENLKKKSESEFAGALKEALGTLKQFNHQENGESKKKIVKQEKCLKQIEEKFLETQERLTHLEEYKMKTEISKEFRTKCQSWLKIQRENGSFPSEEQSDSSPSYSGAQSEEPADFAEVEEARRQRKRERKEKRRESARKEKRTKTE